MPLGGAMPAWRPASNPCAKGKRRSATRFGAARHCTTVRRTGRARQRIALMRWTCRSAYHRGAKPSGHSPCASARRLAEPLHVPLSSLLFATLCHLAQLGSSVQQSGPRALSTRPSRASPVHSQAHPAVVRLRFASATSAYMPQATMVPAGAGRSSRKIFSCQGLSGSRSNNAKCPSWASQASM